MRLRGYRSGQSGEKNLMLMVHARQMSVLVNLETWPHFGTSQCLGFITLHWVRRSFLG